MRSERPVALITGASRGIGEATARELARRGFGLALAARSEADLTRLAGEFNQSGTPALAIPTDMADLAQVERLARITLEHFGRLDALVHNAGIGGGGRLVARSDPRELQHILAVNLEAPIMLTRAVLPHMLEQKHGALIFVGSVAARLASPTSVTYGASKAGLRAFANALRREVSRAGIGVTVVAPGFVDTAMTARLKGIPKARPEQIARVIADAIRRPRREIVTPFYYRPVIWVEMLAPWLIDGLMRVWTRRSRT